jgi:hypothetical protein
MALSHECFYRLVNDTERGLGAEMFLSTSSETEPLRGSPYRRHILEFARGVEPSYPGSPLLAMMLLGRVRVIHATASRRQRRYCKHRPMPAYSSLPASS